MLRQTFCGSDDHESFVVDASVEITVERAYDQYRRAELILVLMNEQRDYSAWTRNIYARDYASGLPGAVRRQEWQIDYWCTRPNILFQRRMSQPDRYDLLLWLQNDTLLGVYTIMFGKIIIGSGIVSAILLIIIFTTITPFASGAFGILAVFFLFYVVSMSTTTILLWIVSRMIHQLQAKSSSSYRGNSMSVRRAYYYASVIALAPVIVISLQSVGGVGFYDLVLIGLFVLLGCLYISRRTH